MMIINECCRMGVDNHTVLSFYTPPQGYWQEGHFHGNNVWASGGKDAPFDQPVSVRLNRLNHSHYIFPRWDTADAEIITPH